MLDLKDLAYARSLPSQPLEAQEQAWLIQWAHRNVHTYPALGRLFHIPNGGGRSKAQGAMLKLQGVRAGVPDLFLPVPRHGCHGLWIEMKSTALSARPSDDQKEWLAYLDANGYRVAVCRGFEAARDVILKYLDDATPVASPGWI